MSLDNVANVSSFFKKVDNKIADFALSPVSWVIPEETYGIEKKVQDKILTENARMIILGIVLSPLLIAVTLPLSAVLGVISFALKMLSLPFAFIADCIVYPEYPEIMINPLAI